MNKISLDETERNYNNKIKMALEILENGGDDYRREVARELEGTSMAEYFYRKGFEHGFYADREKVSDKQLRDWMQRPISSAPAAPGTYMGEKERMIERERLEPVNSIPIGEFEIDGLLS